MAQAFLPLSVEDNSDGWGPVSLPADLQDIPYAPFSKSDRIGRAADWNPPPAARRTDQRDRLYNTGIANAAFTVAHEEDESAFRLVDNRPKARPPGFARGLAPRGGGRGGRGGAQNRGGGSGSYGAQGGRGQFSQRGGRGGQGGRAPARGGSGSRYRSFRDFDKPQRVREASVEIRNDFEMLEDIEFPRLAAPEYDPGSASDIKTCGSLEYYDRAYDKITTTKLAKPLKQATRDVPTSTTSDDPEIRKLADQNAGRVFVTDRVLAVLMVCAKSVLPWDIVATRVGNQLFLDSRPNTTIDLVTVNETVSETAEEKENPEQLTVEATIVNSNFVQTVLSSEEKKKPFGDANPFNDGDDVVSVGYRYRKWSLGDYNIVVRCTVDGVLRQGEKEVLLSLRSLTEVDAKATNWRMKLDQQRSAVLATELKNNINKLARWTAEAVLAGTDFLKIGFVSRTTRTDNTKHQILATQMWRPTDFAVNPIGVSMTNAWGIIKVLCDKLLQQKEGKYLIAKNPNKASMQIYAVPNDAFDAVADDADDDLIDDADK